MKDLFHICLETKGQGFRMTFKVCNLGSKRPHLHRAYVLGVYDNLGTTVNRVNLTHHKRPQKWCFALYLAKINVPYLGLSNEIIHP